MDCWIHAGTPWASTLKMAWCDTVSKTSKPSSSTPTSSVFFLRWITSSRMVQLTRHPLSGLKPRWRSERLTRRPRFIPGFGIKVVRFLSHDEGKAPRRDTPAQSPISHPGLPASVPAGDRGREPPREATPVESPQAVVSVRALHAFPDGGWSQPAQVSLGCFNRGLRPVYSPPVGSELALSPRRVGRSYGPRGAPGESCQVAADEDPVLLLGPPGAPRPCRWRWFSCTGRTPVLLPKAFGVHLLRVVGATVDAQPSLVGEHLPAVRAKYAHGYGRPLKLWEMHGRSPVCFEERPAPLTAKPEQVIAMLMVVMVRQILGESEPRLAQETFSRLPWPVLAPSPYTIPERLPPRVERYTLLARRPHGNPWCLPPSEWLTTLSIGRKCQGTELASSGRTWPVFSVLLRTGDPPGFSPELTQPPHWGGRTVPAMEASGRQASPAKPRDGGMECTCADPSVHRGWTPDLCQGCSDARLTESADSINIPPARMVGVKAVGDIRDSLAAMASTRGLAIP
ncbi:hypothetical protein J6590_090829 [Homalodisca vitripennis]|nr:hypothetical protein J6590_090829 [Homalodisca vitripennis]